MDAKTLFDSAGADAKLIAASNLAVAHAITQATYTLTKGHPTNPVERQIQAFMQAAIHALEADGK